MGDAMTLSASTEIVAVEDCLSTTLDGESVILHTGAGEYYGFNEVGTDIWEAVQEPTTVETLCAQLTDEYEVGADRVRDDVEDLVAELVEKDLVRVVEE